ncbi:MAG: hypothetical protein C4292_04195 [Nitrososphaera sp.]
MTQDYDSVVTTAALSPSSPPPLPDRLEKSPAVGEWLLKTGLSAKVLASIVAGLDAVDRVERRCRVVAPPSEDF